MTIFAIILMVIAMVATVGILFTGIIAMARGGEFNNKWGNRLMRYRILAQMIALAMFAVALGLLRSGS
ncbi:MAG: twin transmembrane helix small protein [Alphaproteobacteria bacterium]|nr:twin transmembrane helix small protein [Alphaproteobacteria bacterium]